MQADKKLPFKIVRSEVTGGYIDKVHSEFTSSIDLVNYHLDIYSGDTSTIQSPFTEKWVGGSLHRHIPLNTGNDDASKRPEAWHLEFDPTGVTIHPHSYLDSPPARWNRETLAKRPINVANIKNNNFGLGNFSQNYEVVQTSGRRITNNLIVDGFIADGVLTSQFINKTPLYYLEYDFSSDTLLSEIDNEDLLSTEGNVIRQGTISPYENIKGLVFRAKPASEQRTLFIKSKLHGNTKLFIKTLHGRKDPSILAGNANFYDYSGFRLEKPDAGENLVLQYSYDNLNWFDYKTIVTGSSTYSETIQVEERKDFIFVDTLEGPYYLRVKQSSHTSTEDSFDQYAILELVIETTPKPYSLPELNKVSGSRSVIVERFNAPGSKEESSRGALDREGEEMSPNIPLPYRNIKIRQPFYQQLSKTTPQFGGTIHNVNRNTLVRGEQEYKDNGYVVHAIPRTDIQYSWITSSTNTTAKELGWYQTFAGTYNRNNAFTDIIFNEKIEIPRNLCKDYDLKTRSSGSYPEEINAIAWYAIKNATSSDGTTVVAISPFVTFDNESPQETSIDIYTKNDDKWNISQTIPFSRISIGQLYYERTINNLCFSGDSTKLFVQVTWTESSSIQHFVYVFEKQNGVWIQDNNITLPSDVDCSSKNLSVNGTGTIFSVSDGDTKVYIYRKNPGGVNSWTSTTISNPDSSGGGFGYSLCLNYHGDRLIIGAYGNEVSGFPGSGQAYLYTYNSTTQSWLLEETFKAPDYDEQGDPDPLNQYPYESRFGWAVTINQNSDPAIDGTVIAVGSPYKAPGGATYFRAGEVYVWELIGISGLPQWTPTQIFLEDRQEYDLFGIDLSLNGRGDLLAISNEKKPQAFLYKKTSDFFLYENSRPRWDLAKIVDIQEPNNEFSSIRHTWISIDQDAKIIALSAPTLDTNPLSSNETLRGIFHIFERPTYLDNNSITSVFKENKKVDIDTATFSMDHSVSHCYPSFSEITNSPYTFTTWETIRNSESPVVKQQRKNNILRIENRTSRLGLGNKNQYLYDNYIEPPVTFKYKPLETYVSLYDTNEVQTIEHTYANNLSAFANKEITRQIATLPEDSRQFYDFLYDHYISVNTAGNPISFFRGFSYSEVVWPKEENTGLSQTRKREAYYLNKSGFDRDGYDRQLGTQRVFWRDLQEDRKRSAVTALEFGYLNNERSTGFFSDGFYNSLNYTPKDEIYYSADPDRDIHPRTTGLRYKTSNYNISDNEAYFVNTPVRLSYNTSLSMSYDYFESGYLGNFNSFLTLEKYEPEEKILYLASSSINNASVLDPDVDTFPKQISAYVSRRKEQEISAEFNEKFVDFYGYSIYYENEQKKYFDIGAYYRNSLYKSVVQNNNYSSMGLGKYWDVGSMMTESDIYRILPKTRYVSFPGGLEINNNSDYLDNLLSESEPGEYQLNSNYFSVVESDSIQISTIDNGLKRMTEFYSGKKPFFDSYEEYIGELYALTKDYSQIPEFIISEHIETYINSSSFYDRDNSPITLDGVDSDNYSSRIDVRTTNKTFLDSYTTSDLLKKHDKVYQENSRISQLESINIKVSGIKKLLPYNGFYPQDRTIQLANIYKDYVDNNLAGGYYSIETEQDYYRSNALEFRGERVINDECYPYARNKDHVILNTSGLTIYSPSDPTFQPQQTIYATSNFFVSYTDPINTAVEIYKVQKKGIPGQTPVLSFQHCGNADPAAPQRHMGLNLKLVHNTTQNTIHLFYTSRAQSSARGKLWHVVSSDMGITWSQPQSIYQSQQADTGFGVSLDAFYDKNLDVLIVAAGEPQMGFDTCGTWVWKSSDDGNSWQIIAFPTQEPNRPNLGFSISMYSGSFNGEAGYYLYSSYFSNSNGGIIGMVSSDAGATWESIKFDPVGGAYLSPEGSGESATTLYPGLGGIKALEYPENNVMLFYSQPYESTDGLVNNGTFRVAYTTDEWLADGRASIFLNKVLNKGSRSNEYMTCGSEAPPQSAPWNYQFLRNNTIDAQINSNGDVSYSCGSPFSYNLYSQTNTYEGAIYVGITDGIKFQTFSNMIKVPIVPGYYEMAGSFVTYLDYTQEAKDNGYEDENGIILYKHEFNNSLGTFSGIKKNIFKLKVEDKKSRQAKDFAAMEPIFAPGILYNTIKSGIAVDWPCATGSNVFYQNEDDKSLINLYFPQPKEMYSFTLQNSVLGEDIKYNARGSIKSKIDYRIPFESILSPNEIFENKEQEVTEDVEESYPAGFSINANSSVTSFLERCYIYGGYETYMDPHDIGNYSNLTTSDKFSVPFTYRKPKYRDNGLFAMAINNFLSETVNFFLEEGKLTTFESKPDNEWPEFNSAKTYYMDVVLNKSEELVMMEAWHSDKHPTGPNGERMDGRYFGYPVNKTTKEIWTGEDFTSDEARLMHNDPAYAPYTPPYFEGKAIARLAFAPSETRKYSVSEIIDNMTVENIFFEAAKGWEEGSDAQVHKMPVEASIDFRGISKTVATAIQTRASNLIGNVTNPGNVVNAIGNISIPGISDLVTLTELPDNKKWIISTRMETPVLDFSSQESVPYIDNTIKKSGFGRGMWSGYGEIPKNGKGISLELSFPFLRQQMSPYADSSVESLLSAVGFEAKTKKVGQIRARGKEIKEAVVLIPYLENPTRSQRKKYTTRQKFMDNLYFIKINDQQYQTQKARIENGQTATEEKQETSITRMITKMKEYVIPPDFNFLLNPNTKPFAMYFFEFTHILGQQDLVDIWQGLMPDISYNSETEEVIIEHESAEDELFGGKELPANLKWFVFRVKQKAVYDFGKITSSTKDDQRFQQTTIVGREEDPYSYNWPYDFFSLVEFAKVEIDLKYKPRETLPEMIAVQVVNNFDNQ